MQPATCNLLDGEKAELAAAVEAWQRDRLTADRRNRAIVKYDPKFARWQAKYDPLFRALVSLRRELASPYKDVPSTPLHLP